MANKEDIDLFVSEGMDLYNDFSNCIPILKKNMNDKDTIEKLFRSLHTLKGNAGFLGVANLYKVYAPCTELIRPIKNGKSQLTKEIFDKLIPISEIINESLNIIKSTNELNAAKRDEYINRLGL
jgi:two-component system, chemotaxis family, sensor kinase CheA